MRSVVVAVILGYIALATAQVATLMFLMDENNKIYVTFGESIKERDIRAYSLQNRVLTLEKQRDMERRVMDIEKQIRTFCSGTKIEMCGKVGPTK